MLQEQIVKFDWQMLQEQILKFDKNVARAGP